MLSRVLLWTVLLFLHACKAAGDVLLAFVAELRHARHSLLDAARRRRRSGSNESESSVLMRKEYLAKLPKHVAVVINDQSLLDNPSRSAKKQGDRLSEYVTRLVRLAATLAVEHVTLYDEMGMLKKKEDTIRSQLRDIVKHANDGDAIKEVPIDAADDSGYVPSHLSNRSGDTTTSSGASTPVISAVNSVGARPSTGTRQHTSKRIRLSILSEVDGRQAMADTASLLASLQRHDAPSHESIQAALDAAWPNRGRRDPDLLIVVGGSQLRLKGYPPWQLRLTEFYHEPSSSSALVVLNRLPSPELTLERGLALYSHCEMRFGR